MLQLVYVSSARIDAGLVDPAAILQASRRNNTRDGITGLLYSDHKRFLQALEGSEAKVEEAFGRISGDPRHRAIVVLSRRFIEAREFGDWAMAHQSSPADRDAFVARVNRMVAKASPNVRATFESFARVRRAA